MSSKKYFHIVTIKKFTYTTVFFILRKEKYMQLINARHAIIG